MKKNKIGKVVFSAFVKNIIGMVVLGAILFLAAGTLRYWQAWAMLPALMVPMGVSGIIFAMQDSGILERRSYKWDSMTAKRKASIILKYAATLSLIIVPALDYRFGWSTIPLALIIIGVAFLVSANVVWIVSKTENPFAGSGIEIYEGHKLCKTGLYAIVRHPNYFGDILLVFGLPLALGSWWGIIGAVPLLALLVERTFDEERFLNKHLSGYKEYMQEVRWRFIPALW